MRMYAYTDVNLLLTYVLCRSFSEYKSNRTLFN